MDSKENRYILRCIEIARNGLGNVAPNPLVGAVLVYNDSIIGEGYHQKYGESHAEINAIEAAQNNPNLNKATLYVNLEPCSHYGKTPPCVDYIINNKIPRVVIGTLDSYPEVNGKGKEKLICSGIEVLVGVAENECRELNKRFFTFYEKKRPYIILKWAETADGFIDVIRSKRKEARPTWITDETIQTLVHKWRTEEQAVMVGTNTALMDNPYLNARNWSGNHPIRIVLDRSLRLPNHLHLFDQSQQTIVFTEKESKSKRNLEYCKINFNEEFLENILQILYEQNIQSVIVEGGTQIINSFIKKGLWDEARVFRSEICFGKGKKAPTIKQLPYEQVNLADTLLYFYKNSLC
jgi:diaminohydroxyphosphoribosylaminopyrimidine deaminase/5-amino-6-(5-phosphoribosylamino)uracil reductase